MLQVANHGDVQAIDSTELFSNSKDIEECLRWVLSRAIASVDQRVLRVLCLALRTA